MTTPLRIEKSPLPFPHQIREHRAVTWRDAVIVWGGRSPTEDMESGSVVYCHRSGKWIRMQTTGSGPSSSYNATVQVAGDRMFVLRWDGGSPSLHTLDLKTWTWASITPKGVPPIEDGRGLSSWVHR